jgi:hypothetical protein
VHFQLFLPDCDLQNIEAEAKRRGVLDLLGDHDGMPIGEGPGNKAGLLVAWLKPGDRHLYAPDQQTWIPSRVKSEAGQPLYYVGIWNDKAPQQAELRRRRSQGGNWCQLGSERWLVPTPKSVDRRAVYIDDSSSMRWEPLSEFSWMCDEARMLHDLYLEETGTRLFVYKIDPGPQIEWLLRLLRVNYRITAEVAAHLDLWVDRDNALLDAFLETLELFRPKGSNDG